MQNLKARLACYIFNDPITVLCNPEILNFQKLIPNYILKSFMMTWAFVVPGGNVFADKFLNSVV